MDARCPCGKEITHPQMQLCDNCYIQYRKGQYRLRDAERRKDPVYVDKINTYQKEKYHSEYRVDRLVNKTCSCGKKALKGSLYSLCRPCSILKAKTRKLKYQMDRKRNHIPTRIRENIKSRLKQAI